MAASSKGAIYNLNGRVTLWLARLGSIGLAIMMFLTLFDVIGRAFSHPIVGAVEITELIMGMMIYLAIGYTTFLRGHIRVDVLITHFPLRVQAILDFITGIIATGFAGFICWRLFLQAASRIDNNDLTQIWEIPIWPFAFVMAISSVLMITSLLFYIYQTGRQALGIDPIEAPDPFASLQE